ncbi:MAG: flagellar export chaperone FliS [Chloroflexi bacterium]|nr:flagellar export chaperone FliS [Chloroflexota bacterium]
MLPRNPYGQYQQTQAETASGVQLVVMLYQGAIRFLNGATRAAEANNVEEAHRCILRAQGIICELMSTLNVDAGPVAMNLLRVYDYMYQRLVTANVKKDAGMLRETAGLLRELLTAWEEVARASQKATPVVGAVRAPGLAYVS